MIGISSKSAGVLLLPKPGTNEYSVLNVVVGEVQDPVEAQYLYSAAQDWEEIESPDADALLETATQEYWLARTVSLLRLALGGLEKPLEKRVLEDVEEIFSSRVSSEKALNRLLVAPLKDPRAPVTLAQSALSHGFSAVASILDELVELQPLLHRLTDIWLSLEETVFSHCSEYRQMIWATVIENCEMKRLLRVGSRREFIAKWNLLVFHFPTPETRAVVVTLGQGLSRILFSHEEQEEIMTDPLTEEVEPERSDEEELFIKDHRVFERVKKQIESISLAVSQGHDTKAERFLRQLVQQQTSLSGGEIYAVKSLCNIAQRCADMFRTDFEVVCINEARRIDPSDAWTLIQYGDHLKRVGDYDGALKVFAQAKELGESEVAKSSEADVYSQQGDYVKANETYETIPNWKDKPMVLTAIADNLRRMGRMEDAQDAYNRLINPARQVLPEYAMAKARAQAGIAEIAKRQGKLDDASQTYYGIIARRDIDEHDMIFYKLGLCNVLKLMGKFDDAYEIVDQVIQQYPFSMEARFTRGSILGLTGREIEGLKDLPESSGSRSFREWLRRYYRGLLLLKLKRYKDAKKDLVDELPIALASGEEKEILRMAAAQWFLGQGNILEANKMLSRIPNLNDDNSQYLALVLKLHTATLEEDIATKSLLMGQISKLQVVDVSLKNAVVALGEKNFSLALTYETDALLKLAA